MQVSTSEVVRQLSTLPPERIAQVYDFVLFLKTRTNRGVDEDDEWSEADRRDASRSSLNYAEVTFLAKEASDDSAARGDK